jgi:hypothetical protein
VGWRWELRHSKDGRLKWTKPPRTPSGQYASNNDATSWASCAAIWQGVTGGRFDGIGLELMGLPQETLVAIDLDDVRDPTSGALLGWAAAVVAGANSYTEITPSACGLRILGTAHGLPDIHCKIEHPDGGSFELYVGGPVRFITVTAHRFGNAPDVLNDITAVIRELYRLDGSRSKPNGNGAADWVPPDNHAAAPIDLDRLDSLIAEQIRQGTLRRAGAEARSGILWRRARTAQGWIRP